MSTPKNQRPLMNVVQAPFFDIEREYVDLDHTLRAAGFTPTPEQVAALLIEGVRGAGVWTANRTMKETQTGIDTENRIRAASQPQPPQSRKGTTP